MSSTLRKPRKSTNAAPAARASKRSPPPLPKSPAKAVGKAIRPSARSQGVSSLAIHRKPSSMKISSASFTHRERVKGREFVSTLTAGSTVTPGTILFSRRNAPNPVSTRLERLAGLYERWRPLKYNYIFTPTQPTTFAGTLVFAQDPDAIAAYSDTSTNLARLMTLEGNVVTQCWQSAVCGLSPSRDYTDLWTLDSNPGVNDPDDRLVAPGVFLVAIAATGAIVAGTVLGLMEIEYDFEFYSPKIAQPSMSDEAPWLRFTGAAIDSLLALQGTGGIMNAVFSILRDQLSAPGTSSDSWSSVIKVLRDWIPYFDVFADGERNGIRTHAPGYYNPYSSEMVGFPRGEYKFQFHWGSNKAASASQTMTISTIAGATAVSVLSTYQGGSVSQVETAPTSGTTRLPNGTAVLRTIPPLEFAFAVNNQRAWADQKVEMLAAADALDELCIRVMPAHGMLLQSQITPTAEGKWLIGAAARPRKLPEVKSPPSRIVIPEDEDDGDYIAAPPPTRIHHPPSASAVAIALPRAAPPIPRLAGK